MTYTSLAVIAVVVAVVWDRWVVRARLTRSGAWWTAYAIVVGFQLLTNGWLTGRGIVRYDPGAILGSGRNAFLGAGRIAFAPVEDLAFGFALVLVTCATWVRLGRPRSTGPDATGPG